MLIVAEAIMFFTQITTNTVIITGKPGYEVQRQKEIDHGKQ